jgi:thiaminase (transcriptional activator TenA)
MTQSAGTGGGASERMRACVRAEWDAAVTHPFVLELCAGTLPAAAMRRYLVQDYQFVDAFTALLGATVACADSAAARMVLARQLGVLSGPESTYFQRAFDALEVPGPERDAPRLLAPTAELIGLMRQVALSLDYPSCLTILVAAEWLYLNWARRAPIPLPADAVAREWIEIHDNPDFCAWVEFLRGELDGVFLELPADARKQCEQVFAQVTQLELAFFDAAYAEPAPRGAPAAGSRLNE